MTYINSEIKKRIISEIKWNIRIPYQRFLSLSSTKKLFGQKRLNKFVGCKRAEVIFVKNINQKIFIRGYNATLTQIKRCRK